MILRGLSLFLWRHQIRIPRENPLPIWLLAQNCQRVTGENAAFGVGLRDDYSQMLTQPSPFAHYLDFLNVVFSFDAHVFHPFAPAFLSERLLAGYYEHRVIVHQTQHNLKSSRLLASSQVSTNSRIDRSSLFIIRRCCGRRSNAWEASWASGVSKHNANLSRIGQRRRW